MPATPKNIAIMCWNDSTLSIEDFVYKSSGLVADTFGICERGYLREGNFADIAIIDPETFGPVADFQNPEELSIGVNYLFVNGQLAISNGESQPNLPGRVLKKCK